MKRKSYIIPLAILIILWVCYEGVGGLVIQNHRLQALQTPCQDMCGEHVTLVRGWKLADDADAEKYKICIKQCLKP